MNADNENAFAFTPLLNVVRIHHRPPLNVVAESPFHTFRSLSKANQALVKTAIMLRVISCQINQISKTYLWTQLIYLSDERKTIYESQILNVHEWIFTEEFAILLRGVKWKEEKENLLLRFNAKLKGVFGFWPLKIGKIQQFGRTEIPISLGLNHKGFN